VVVAENHGVYLVRIDSEMVDGLAGLGEGLSKRYPGRSPGKAVPSHGRRGAKAFPVPMK
jgi:hypothetical protein